MANIAIIGGGVAGLCAGIYAQMNGHHATVYERHSRAGGNLTGWDREGYHIDNCIHWLTGTNPLTSLYRTWENVGALGDGIEIYRAETLYTFERNGQRISLSRQIERLERDMLALSPEDKREIHALVRAVKALQRLNGIAGANCDQRSTLPQRILSIPCLLRYYTLSTKDLSKRFHHPLLKGFLESVISDRFGALALLTAFATFSGKNGDVPVGSSCAMAKRMEERFLSLGGRLCLKRGVAKINLRESAADSLTLEDGSVEEVDYVVIATDPATAFGKLLDSARMPRTLKRQYDDPSLLRFSSYHCAFACDSKALPFRGDLILEIPEPYQKALHASYLILREFSHEKSFAPEGKNVLQAMIYCAEEDARAFIELRENKEAYEARKQELASHIQETVTAALPSLRGTLRCLDVWTPATYQRYVGSEVGSWMSFVFPKRRLPKKLSGNVKGLDNVILGTQWLQSPGGLPIAAKTGIKAVELISKKEKRALRKQSAQELPQNVRLDGQAE